MIPKNKTNRLLFGLLFALFLFTGGTVSAQYPTVVEREGFDGQKRPGASSMLTPHTAEGRFGSTKMGGTFSPFNGADSSNSRFQGSAVFTPGGSFRGFSGSSPGSRFQSNLAPPTAGPGGTDYLQYREFLEQKRQGANPVTPIPEQVQAQSQSPLPYPVARRNRFSIYESEYMRENLGLTGDRLPPESVPAREGGQQQQLWMRNPANNATVLPPATGMTGSPNLFGGGLNQPAFSGNDAMFQQPTGTPAPLPIPPAMSQPTAAQLQESFREYLELLLLRSPNVNPLSPIEVRFQEGTATIRGVVPTQAHRIEAGRILLTDPRVKTVDNKLTILPTDPMQPLPPIR